MSIAARGARYLAREAVDGAVFYAVAPTGAVVGRGADMADRLYRASRHVDRGVDGLRAVRGLRGAGARVHAGGEFFHGASDRANALAQIGIDAQILERELAAASSDTDRAWVADVAAPVFSAWKDFLARTAAGGLAVYTTEWSVYQSWRERFLLLRSLAKSRGIPLASPEPPPLQKTIWERAASGEGSKLDGYLAIGKTVILGAITLTGVIGFYSVLRDLHHPPAVQAIEE